jgi:hypothetical protein
LISAFPGGFNLSLAHPSFGNTLAELRRDMDRLGFVKQQIKEIETTRAKRSARKHHVGIMLVSKRPWAVIEL